MNLKQICFSIFICYCVVSPSDLCMLSVVAKNFISSMCTLSHGNWNQLMYRKGEVFLALTDLAKELISVF